MCLVDRDRVVFKSQSGLPEDLAQSRQMGREVSVCGHVVAGNVALAVEDLFRDRRFASNPWIRERGLCFYAGAPLRGVDGQPIGSLCIFDIKPRAFTERDKRQLQEYANELSEELTRRAAG